MYKEFLEKRIEVLEEIIKDYDYYSKLFSKGSLSSIEARLSECKKNYDIYIAVSSLGFNGFHEDKENE